MEPLISLLPLLVMLHRCPRLEAEWRWRKMEAEGKKGGVTGRAGIGGLIRALSRLVVTVISFAHARWPLFPAFQMSTCAAF